MAGISYAPVINEKIIESEKSTYRTKNQRVFVLDNTSVFGDIAPCQKWIADIKINEISQDTHIFEYRLGEDYKKLEEGHEYTFEMEFDLNKYFQAEDKDKVKFATISCKEKTDGPNSNYIIKKTTYRPAHINTADSKKLRIDLQRKAMPVIAYANRKIKWLRFKRNLVRNAGS